MPWLEDVLSNANAREAIPSLNAVNCDQVPDGSLVRFYGMVQDVRDPEYYEGMFECADASGSLARVVTGKYRDCVDSVAGLQPKPSGSHIWQRLPVVCVPVPSQSEWAAGVVCGPSLAADVGPPAGSRPKKRAMECEEVEQCGEREVEMEVEEGATESGKKSRPALSIETEPCRSSAGGAVRERALRAVTLTA